MAGSVLASLFKVLITIRVYKTTTFLTMNLESIFSGFTGLCTTHVEYPAHKSENEVEKWITASSA